MASLGDRYTPKARISWHHDSHEYWEMLKGGYKEGHIEQDVYDVVLDAIKAFKAKLEIVQDDQDPSIHEVSNNITKWMQTGQYRVPKISNFADDK